MSIRIAETGTVLMASVSVSLTLKTGARCAAPRQHIAGNEYILAMKNVMRMGEKA